MSDAIHLKDLLDPILEEITRKVTTRENGTRRCQTVNTKPSMTKQSSKKECCINSIMAQFSKTGLMPEPMSERRGQYGDFTGLESYHQAKSMVAAANQEFLTLPSNVRSYFKNNPENLIDFLDNPDNLEKAIELGLTNPLPPPKDPPKDPEPTPPTEPTN